MSWGLKNSLVCYVMNYDQFHCLIHSSHVPQQRALEKRDESAYEITVQHCHCVSSRSALILSSRTPIRDLLLEKSGLTNLLTSVPVFETQQEK